jgi:hypothetical protein
MTRRRTTRRQWQQISQLRPHGSLGHPQPICPAYSHAPFAPAMDESRDNAASDWRAEAPVFQEHSPEPPPIRRYRDRRAGLGSVMALAIALFVLACAYSGFSGYMHAMNDALAWFGVVGAISCLAAAAMGICLSLSITRRQYSGRFLGIATIFMASLYGVMLISSVSR